MNWQEVERSFNRSLHYSFSKRKIAFVFPVLLLCGVVIVLFRALASQAGDWVKLSLSFFPIFLFLALMLSSGVVLVRLYHHEVKGLAASLKETITKSSHLMIALAYLSLPVVLLYILLWTVIGFFYLIREIPVIGDAMSILLSFGPFLLVLSFLLLGSLNILLLFFYTPAVALRSQCSLQELLMVCRRVRTHAFSHLIWLCLGLLPVAAMLGFLYLAAYLTETSYVQASGIWSQFFHWTITMIPFCACMAPFGIFFFNFAAEAYVWAEKRLTQSAE